MNLLLDTHAFLWIARGDSQLSDTAKTLIEDVENTKYVSMASVWEMAIKLTLDKLTLAQPFGDFLTRHLDGNGFEGLSVKRDHVLGLLSLPLYHRDPFDRLLISQSITKVMQLISIDALFDTYDIHRVW